MENLVSLVDLTGADGTDGLGIESVVINQDGELVVTYTDGSESKLEK